MVRAKFKCISKHQNGEGDNSSFDIRMEPVVATDNPDDENSKFFKYTPGGVVSLHCLNPAASAQFEVDQEYYLDFTPAQ